MGARELHRAPRILPLYARAAAPLIPGASLLPFVGGGGGEIPELALTLSGVRIDSDRLAAYAHVCGFSLRDTLPATYLHVLAFPLHLALMADGRFPFGAIGLVHMSNRITQHRPVRTEEPLDLHVHATPLQDHPRGGAFSLLSEARVSGELVWEELSTMLRRTGGAAEKPADPARSSERAPHPEPPPCSAQWSLPGDLGRRYAAVSGDRNPIHLYALTAKPLGFPRQIVHGMWTKARCLAALEQLLADAFAVEVDFRRPIALPGKVRFGSVREGSSIRFAVHDRDQRRAHLEGSLQPAGRTGRQEDRQASQRDALGEGELSATAQTGGT